MPISSLDEFRKTLNPQNQQAYNRIVSDTPYTRGLALQEAQLNHLNATTDMMSKQFGLDEKKFDFTKLEAEAQRKLQELGIAVNVRGQDIHRDTTIRGQDISQSEGAAERNLRTSEGAANRALTSRGLDLEQQRNDNIIKLGGFDRVISAIANHPDVDTKAVADTMAEMGFPAFAAVLQKGKDQKIQETLPTHVQTVTAIADPKARDTYINSIKDVDERRAVRAALDVPGTKPGELPAATQPSAANYPGYLPNLGLDGAVRDLPLNTARLGATIGNATVVPVNNLVGSVLGTPPMKRLEGPKRYSDIFNR